MLGVRFALPGSPATAGSGTSAVMALNPTIRISRVLNRTPLTPINIPLTSTCSITRDSPRALAREYTNKNFSVNGRIAGRAVDGRPAIHELEPALV